MPLRERGRALLWETINRYRSAATRWDLRQAEIDIECMLVGTPYERPPAANAQPGDGVKDGAR